MNEANQYRLVKLGHYSARQLADPAEVPWDFAIALLRGDNAWHAAQAEANRREAGKHTGKGRR